MAKGMTADPEGILPPVVDPEEFRPDPHAGYARYRPETAIIDLGGGLPVVIRHADCAAMMTDPRTRQAQTEVLEQRGIRSGALFRFYANSVLLSNRPDHGRRRAPLTRTFAAKLIEAWRPRIRDLVTELADEAAAQAEFDFLERVAEPLPSRLIAEILGAPREDAPRFAAMVYEMSRGLGGFRVENFAPIEAAAEALTDYVEDLLERRRREPRDDFLSHYLERVSGQGGLDDSETLIQIVTLIIGGSDTTRFALTALVGLLLSHPEQWRALCADPGLVRGAVLEGLRYEPSVGSIGRVVAEPMTIDGMALSEGSVIQISILSAQRDETIYAEPDRFDIARPDHPRWSLTFGLGAHRCLGEALARAEIEEAINVLSTRLPDLRLAGPPPAPMGHMGIRGISSLHVGA
jgi:cytochrome P450